MKLKNPSSHLPVRTTIVTLALAATMSLGQASASPKDLDGDGVSNRFDRDIDGDGLFNGADSNVDGGVCRKGPFKGKFVGDRLKNDNPREKDIDGDGRPDTSDDDIDGDGIRNGLDDDCDGDGKGRSRDQDDDGDGIDDNRDDDDDNDGLSDDDGDDDDDNGNSDDNSSRQSFTSLLVKAPGLSSEAEGKVEIQAGATGVTGLEVEVEAIPAGAYDFIVDGVNRGTLSVVLDKDKLRGKLRYEVVPDGNGEILLDFPVAGKSIVISQGATKFFSGTAPNSN